MFIKRSVNQAALLQLALPQGHSGGASGVSSCIHIAGGTSQLQVASPLHGTLLRQAWPSLLCIHVAARSTGKPLYHGMPLLVVAPAAPITHQLQWAVTGECGVLCDWFCRACRLPRRPHPPWPAGETEPPHGSAPIALALLPRALRHFFWPIHWCSALLLGRTRKSKQQWKRIKAKWSNG